MNKIGDFPGRFPTDADLRRAMERERRVAFDSILSALAAIFSARRSGLPHGA